MNKKHLKRFGYIVFGVSCLYAAYRLGIKNGKLSNYNSDEIQPDVIREIKIYNKKGYDSGMLLNSIYEQIAGNEDYVDCNIVLNDDVIVNGNDIIGDVVTYTVYEESKTNPTLNISV